LRNACNLSEKIAFVSENLFLTIGDVPSQFNSLACVLLNTGYENGTKLSIEYLSDYVGG